MANYSDPASQLLYLGPIKKDVDPNDPANILTTMRHMQRGEPQKDLPPKDIMDIFGTRGDKTLVDEGAPAKMELPAKYLAMEKARQEQSAPSRGDSSFAKIMRQMSQAQAENKKQSLADLKPLQQYLQKYQQEQARPDLSPILAMGSALTGKDYSKYYKPPQTQEERDKTIVALQSEIAKQKGDIRKEEISSYKTQLVAAAARQKAMDKGFKLTKGEEKVDTTFGAEYTEWNERGRSLLKKNLGLLKRAMEKLKTAPESMSGRVVGRLPDMLKPEESIYTRDLVHQAAQASLRATLGAQFTAEEGVRIMGHAYNEKLEPEKNIIKIQSTIDELESNARSMDSRSSYFERTGTLKGWKSPRSGVDEPSKDDTALKKEYKEYLKSFGG